MPLVRLRGAAGERFAVPLAADLDVVLARRLAAFLERVEDVDGFVELCDIEHPMLGPRINPQPGQLLDRRNTPPQLFPAIGPRPGHLDELGFTLRPVVQGGRVEVRAVRPDERVALRTH